MFLRFVMFTFWNYYVVELLSLETITFSDATLSDINVVLCYVLSQYRKDAYIVTIDLLYSNHGKRILCRRSTHFFSVA